MAYTYSINLSENISTISASGKITFDEMMNQTMKMLNENDWQPGCRLLVDYRKIDDITVNGKNLRSFFNRLKKAGSKLNNSRIAIVTQKDCAFCLVRLWESLSEKRLDVTSKIFGKVEDAESWLVYTK
jgi:hypothetical protein